MGWFLPHIEAFQQPLEMLQRDALRGAVGIARGHANFTASIRLSHRQKLLLASTTP